MNSNHTHHSFQHKVRNASKQHIHHRNNITPISNLDNNNTPQKINILTKNSTSNHSNRSRTSSISNGQLGHQILEVKNTIIITIVGRTAGTLMIITWAVPVNSQHPTISKMQLVITLCGVETRVCREYIRTPPEIEVQRWMLCLLKIITTLTLLNNDFSMHQRWTPKLLHTKIWTHSMPFYTKE